MSLVCDRAVASVRCLAGVLMGQLEFLLGLTAIMGDVWLADGKAAAT
jgi:hypothetical protein